jgi:tetratricopeptide repeat protein/aspartyl protease
MLSAAAGTAFAVTCNVVQRGAASDAEKAFLAANFDEAAELYRADLAKNPGDEKSTLGLVHVLLKLQKVDDAAATVKTALAVSPKSAALLTLRGEVELRQGEPWAAEATAVEAYKLDACNPRTRFLYAKIAMLNSRFATARQQIVTAHEFDPGDQEIRGAWIQTLGAKERIAELESYLADPNGNDPMELAQLRGNLERWKAEQNQPTHACRLVSGGPSAEIPFIRLAGYAGHTRAYGLEVKLNGGPVRLQIDTRGEGLTVFRSAAEHADLKRVVAEASGGSQPGGKPNYTAVADSVRIGNLEFKDCPVNVKDSNSPFDDGAGFIGVDVFENWLVTVDFPMRTLKLDPLPAAPDAKAEAPRLMTMAADYNPVAPETPPHDRAIAPELKDYSQIYRVGHDLLLPTALAPGKVKLFVPDDQVPFTNISQQAASAVTKVHEDPHQEYGPQKVFVADEIALNFAHVSQKINGVVITDTSMASKMNGAEISGFLGNNTLTLLTLHIDYRDGLLKADFVPGRGYKFDDNSSGPTR